MLVEAPATTLQRLRVADAMHPGTIACPPETPLRAVARMMATFRVHSILVLEHRRDGRPLAESGGVVSDLALVRAAQRDDFDRLTAGDLAAEPAPVVTGGEELDRAVRLMVEGELSHLVVVEPHTGRPVGVLSTIDVARVVAGVPRP
jgi:CBS domain-containing protein